MVKNLIRKILLLTIILVFNFAFILNIQPVRARDIHVPYDYDTIQKAINAASPGDHIYVTGTYHEHITVNKTLSLIGEGEAIIDGDGIGTVVNITADGVTITNFKIFNAGPERIEENSGILLLNTTNCFIINNWVNNSGIGINIKRSSYIRIIENNITHTGDGLVLFYSSQNTVLSNNFQNNSYNVIIQEEDTKFNTVKDNFIKNGGTGIELSYITSHNLIEANTITNQEHGIEIWYYCSNNTIINNWITNNEYGIYFYLSSNNTIYHNNFINNTNQARVDGSYYNEWDIGWPDGGNYWSNHNLKDDYSGQYQTEPGSDGICDTPYTVYGTDMDKYPLAAPINLFEVPLGFVTEEVNIISNSTISHFQTNTTQKIMKFNVTGEGAGFCRVDIPNTVASMWNNNYTVLVNGKPPTYMRNWTLGTTTYIYFTYLLSEKEVIIIPEFPPLIILTLCITLTLLITITHYSRKRCQKAKA